MGVFDRIVCYSPKNLPRYITSSPLMVFARGGGYWVWKPWIVFDALCSCKEDDIVWYMDAGCTLNPLSKEWAEYINFLNNSEISSLFFQYRNIDYGWKSYFKITDESKLVSTRIGQWMKPLVVDFFKKQYDDDSFLDYNKIWAGFMILKKECLPLIQEWLSITLLHPELVIDPLLGERIIDNNFIAHRHDQAILTPLIYFYKEKYKIRVLPETSESEGQTAAIVASRVRKEQKSLLLMIKNWINRLVH